MRSLVSRLAGLAVLLLALGASTSARADVVSACPPGFSPSHSGCHFDPGPSDLYYLVCCCGLPLVAAAVAGIVLARRKKAPRPDA